MANKPRRTMKLEITKPFQGLFTLNNCPIDLKTFYFELFEVNGHRPALAEHKLFATELYAH